MIELILEGEHFLLSSDIVHQVLSLILDLWRQTELAMLSKLWYEAIVQAQR